MGEEPAGNVALNSLKNSRYSSINLMCSPYKRKTEGGRTFSVTSSQP